MLWKDGIRLIHNGAKNLAGNYLNINLENVTNF